MNLNLSQNGEQCSIAVSGEIDEHGAEELKKRFREVANGHWRLVQVDFKGVTHIGSAGIGKLLVLYKELAVRRGELKLVNVPNGIYQLFCEMKLNNIFAISQLPAS